MYRSAACTATAWNVATGNPNCSRLPVYSAVIASTRSPRPSASAQVPVVSRDRSHSQAPAASITSWASARAPSSRTSARRSPLVETWSARVTPARPGSTRARTVRPSAVWAGTAIRSAACAQGTADCTPFSTQPEAAEPAPSGRAATARSAGAWPVLPLAAAVRTNSPRTARGSSSAARARSPYRPTVIATAQLSSSGTLASTLADSRRTRQRATGSSPAPPYSSGSVRPSRSEAASAPQSLRSMSSATAPGVRAGLGTSSGATPEKTARAASTAARCSSVKVKSTVPASRWQSWRAVKIEQVLGEGNRFYGRGGGVSGRSPAPPPG